MEFGRLGAGRVVCYGMNTTALIIAAFALLTDMAVTANDDGTFTVTDVAMKGTGNVVDAAQAAYLVLSFLRQDGRQNEAPEGLEAAGVGSEGWKAAQPKAGGFPVFNDAGNQVG